MRARSFLAAAAVALLATHGACQNVQCDQTTTPRFDPATGITTCVNATTMVKCDPATTLNMNGLCVADPSRYPKCGPGTILDAPSNQCVPSGVTTITPKACDRTQMTGRYCVNGVVRFLKDNKYTKGTVLEVRAYDPLGFLADPKNTPPLQTVMTDANGTFVMNNLPDPGAGLLALAVTDVGGPMTYTLSASALQGVTAGANYQLDLFAVEKSLVATWDQQASLSGNNTFEALGAYVAIFQDKKVDQMMPMEQMGMRIPGVTLLMNAMPAPSTFYFKGSFTMLDPTQKMTDAATGAGVQAFPMGAGLPSFSGMGGGVTWETVPGASVAGVVFVQWFHPKA